jgi:hypothetical protein
MYGGKRSPHLIANQFWKLVHDYKSICILDSYSGGNGDGDVAETETDVLVKIGKTLKTATEEGKIKPFTTNHSPIHDWEVFLWKKDSVGGIFALLDSQ